MGAFLRLVSFSACCCFVFDAIVDCLCVSAAERKEIEGIHAQVG